MPSGQACEVHTFAVRAKRVAHRSRCCTCRVTPSTDNVLAGSELCDKRVKNKQDQSRFIAACSWQHGMWSIARCKGKKTHRQRVHTEAARALASTGSMRKTTESSASGSSPKGDGAAVQGSVALQPCTTYSLLQPSRRGPALAPATPTANSALRATISWSWSELHCPSSTRPGSQLAQLKRCARLAAMAGGHVMCGRQSDNAKGNGVPCALCLEAAPARWARGGGLGGGGWVLRWVASVG